MDLRFGFAAVGLGGINFLGSSFLISSFLISFLDSSAALVSFLDDYF